MSPFDAARGLLASARRVAVLTGAGMSAESGVPTFRDALTGLWARFDPAQLATPEAFRADPALVWRWYAERRAGVARAHPHAGHRALAAAAASFERFALVTQNVDGLHARADCPACGAWLRPGVVWFGEALDEATLARAEREVAQAEVVLVVGTSGLVYPAAGLPRLARAAGAKVVVVNPNPSDIDDVADVIVAASAAQALPALFAPH